MGDLPLRTPKDRRLGGPLPRLPANPTHRHPSPNLSFIPSHHAAKGNHGVLILLSEGCPPDWGRFDTRYAPVRRSPANEASFTPAAPRLACVKPVASVHPEPGSNSPLYIFFIVFSVSELHRILSKELNSGTAAPHAKLNCMTAAFPVSFLWVWNNFKELCLCLRARFFARKRVQKYNDFF